MEIWRYGDQDMKIWRYEDREREVEDSSYQPVLAWEKSEVVNTSAS